MNKRIFSAIVSIAMTATMLPMTVFAEDEVSKGGTSNGEIDVTLEGIVDKDVFSVALPTSDLTQFDFIIDPQGLITGAGTTAVTATTTGSLTNTGSHSAVTHDKYADAEFEPGKTMYFKSYTAATPSSTDLHEYTSTSAPITIENKSSIGINASVDFVISGVDGVTFTSDNTFAGDESTSMYLAVNTTEYEWDGSLAGTVNAGAPTKVEFATADGVTSAKAEVELKQTNDGVYSYKYDSIENVYSYELDDDKVAGTDALPDTSDDYKFESFEITLTGAVNPAGDWFALAEGDATNFAPKIDVVFDIALDGYDNEDAGSGGSGGSSAVSYSMTAYNDAVVLPSTSIASAMVGTVKLTTSHYTLSGNNFTIKQASTYNTLLTKGSQIDITFSDGTDPITIAISNGA